MFTQKPRLQLEKFAINGAKRLLQHNRPILALKESRSGRRFEFRGNPQQTAPACHRRVIRQNEIAHDWNR
jgi:hypothetical protein